MSEMLKWAEKFVKKANDMSTPVSAGVVDSHLYGLACAILADADPSNAATSPEPLPWDGEWGIPELSDDDEPAARPSGGEGAPEPDDRAILRRLYGAAIGNAGVYPPSEWTDCATKDYQHLCDRLPPEREACSSCTEGEPPYFCRECVHRREEGLREALEREAEAREPDAMTYAKDPRRDLAEWSEVLAVRRFDPEKCKTDGSGPPWPVFFGTPGPDREAEDGLEAAVSLMADREAEIRADAERKARRALLDELVRLSRDPKLSMPKILARLSPTDEQESPNRSDEP